ncbi:MAG: PAS domain S-box protein [bacterium]
MTDTDIRSGRTAWGYRDAVVIVFGLAAYVLADVMMRPLGPAATRIMAFYPGAGAAFVLLLLGGSRWFWLLFVARLILLWWPSTVALPASTVLVDAFIHAAVYTAGARLVSARVNVARAAWRVKDVGWLLTGMLASAFVQGVAAALVATWQSRAVLAQFRDNVRAFAVGDAIGMMVVVPLVLFVLRPILRRNSASSPDVDVYVGSPDAPVAVNGSRQRTLARVAPLALLTGTLAMAAVAVLNVRVLPGGGLLGLLIPLSWLALREGLRGSALVMVVYGVGFLLIARFQAGAAQQFPLMQTNLLVLGFTGMLLGAARTASTESAARYWHLVATAAEGIWRLDDHGNTLSVNPRMAAILGCSEAEVLGRNAADFIAPEDLERWRGERSRRARGEASTYEMSVARPDGSRATVVVNASPVRSVSTRESVGSVAVVTDVTALRHAQTETRRAQILLEVAFHSSHDAMELHRVSDGVLIDVNPVWSMVTGHRREDVIGRSLTDLGIWGDPADSARMDAVVREHGFTRDFEIPFNHRSPDGSMQRGYALLSAYPVELEGVAYMLVTGRDITVAKRTEETQRQVKRMEELGRLAGGVAHDFNNLLTVIMAYAQLARDSIDAGEPVAGRDIEEIEAAAVRGSQLTHRLLAFSRQQPTSLLPVNLNDVIQRAQGMLSSLLMGGVRLRLEFADELPSIMADVGQLDQVLLNLAVNARDAMPDGGEVLFRTSTLHVREGEASELVGPDTLPGDYVVLTVKDNGVGMDAATQARIFEPFFTTKPVGEGTGLGLSVIFAIVRQARGAVRVRSARGEGSTFTIFWPTAAFAAMPLGEPRLAKREPLLGGHVLVIEDEPTVGRITRRVLEDAGFEVSTASDGSRGLACLEQLRAEGRIPDVVLSDISMPVLGGHGVASRLLHSDPGLPVILVSGYDEHSGEHPIQPNVPFAVVKKPYDVGALIGVVRSAIALGRADGDAAHPG